MVKTFSILVLIIWKDQNLYSFLLKLENAYSIDHDITFEWSWAFLQVFN